ncbi:MAG: PL29 family lyase N-terminal domain-containing protein [Prevotella sp.]|nr:PL29 family lyase N-terminal domain-containing protein [Prevotella sp.]
MKIKFLSIIALSFTLTLIGCKYDDTDLWNQVHDLDNRLTAVEQALSELNQNVGSMKTVLTELQSNVRLVDYKQTSTGYVLTFSDGKTITIKDGATPMIGENGNWWINGEDTGIKAIGVDGATPQIGENGNWWINGKDTGVQAKGHDGATPVIIDGYWWINGKNTGVMAVGQTPSIGENGNWWFGQVDTGVQAVAASPYIGENGNWWIGNKDTGVRAAGIDGITPHIGENGNWWIGNKDTGYPASGVNGNSSAPIIGVKIDVDGIYYWTVTVDGVENWLYDDYNNKISCSGVQPIFRIDYQNHLQYSLNNGITWIYVYNEGGNFVTVNECQCTQFFQRVYVEGNYFYMVLIDGTVIRFLLTSGERGDIPEDPTTPIPDVQDPNIPIPYPGGEFTIDEWGNCVYSMSVSGITDVDGNWLKLFGTGLNEQNVWVDVDGQNKGIIVINLEDNTIRMKNDIVFSVDNSGSMYEEADALARDILDWANELDKAGLDVRFAVVGYDGTLSGARNICTASELSTYLNSNGSGTSRTYHFGGSDASKLESAASSYYNSYYECGSCAIQYANNNFSFRTGANRTYVNFTDEPNQPNYKAGWSVEFFASQQNWPSQYGTIHSVYSDTYTSYTESKNYIEYPWRMAEYTGGTKKFTNSSFTGVSLSDLPISDALMHSYTIRFIIPLELLDGLPHTVTIIVKTSDGKTRGKLVLSNFVFGLYR